MTRLEKLIADGWVPVDLKAGNVKVGDTISTYNMLFGKLVNITKKGNYMIRLDIDYVDERPYRLTAKRFESFYLVKKS